MRDSPGTALLKRELLTALRSGRVYALLVLTLLLTVAIVVVTILSLGFAGGGWLSPALLLSLTLCLYGAAGLFLPPLAAVAICMEKQRDTWPLLQTSLVPPWQIVLAKILNVLVIYLLIVVSSFPLVGVLFFFVGIDFRQFYHAMAVVIFTGIAVASLSVLCSAFFYRTLAAIAAAYAGVILFVGGAFWLLVGGMLAFGLSLLVAGGIFHMLASRSAEYLFLKVMRTFIPLYDIVLAVPSFGPPGFTGVSGLSCIYLAALSLLCFYATVALVRRAPRPIRVNQRKLIDDVQQLELRRKQFPYYLIDPQRRRKAIPDRRNPMFAKEVLASMVGRGTNLVRIGYVFAIPFFFYSLFLFVFSSMQRGFEELLMVFQFIQGILLLVLAPALVANSVVKEHELGNMDMLRMTLLSPRQIVLGKLVGGAAGLLAPAIGMAMGSLPVVVTMAWQPDHVLRTWLATYVAFLLSLLLVVTLTLRISVACRSLTTAMVMSYLTALVLLLCVPLGLAVMSEGLRYPWEYFVMQMKYYPSPPATILTELSTRGWRDVAVPFWTGWMVTLGLSIVLFLASVQHFKRRHMREK